ncbi:MAG: glycosyltransferase family 9 protein [Bacteroidota bacterium]|nr:glycosyltransferase family 9 protein [Bacteroidota bacterium]
MKFKKILLTRMKYIGDVVLTTPIIRTLREVYPDAHISYLADAKAVTLLQNNPFLDEIIPFDFLKDSFPYQLKMYALMFSKKFDLTIDLYSNPRSALMTFATRAKMRIGGNSKSRGKFYTHRISDDGSLKSAIDYHYMSLKPLGIAPKYYKTEIFLTDEEKSEAKRTLLSFGVDVSRKIVAVHPGATWPNKIWFKEQFAGLIKDLIESSDCEIILSPGPGDSELMNYLKNNYNSRVTSLPLLPVRELASVLSQTSVFVSNDCGPMHIGVAVGTKTIGIFGPEPIEIWFPYDRNEGHLPMFKKLFCSPCRTTSCFRQGNEYMECMKLITVDEVYKAVRERL